ncbi:MAG: cupin domain-containing protein [Actinomycetota bacterium]
MGEADPVVLTSEQERRTGAPTLGMHREEAIATDTTWAGFVRTEAGMLSGWHHHGEYESVIYLLTGRLRMESGPGGTSVVEAVPGDFLLVPRGAIHREANPADVEATAIVVRSGRGEPVVNVEGPAGARFG